MNPLEKQLILRSGRCERVIAQLEERGRAISRYRLSAFLGAAILAIIAGQWGQSTGWTVFLIGMIPFGVLVNIHQRVDRALKRWKTWRHLTHEDLARLRLDWDALPVSDVPEPDPDHPFSSDLNLLGRRSLSHLIDTTITTGGSHRLGDWLLEPDLDVETIRWRQRLVQDLADIPYILQKLRWVARMESGRDRDRWNTQGIAEWIQRRAHHRLDFLLGVLSGLSLLTWIGLILWAVGLIGGWWIFSFVIYVVIYGLNGGQVLHLSEESSDLHESLGRFGVVFRFLARRIPVYAVSVMELTSPFRDQSAGPLASLRRLRRIAFAGGITRNDVFFIILNALMPWNVIFTWLLEREKVHLRSQLPAWLDRWYTLEAGTALAQVAILNPDHCWPEPADWPEWYAEEMSHPLLHYPTRVYNSHHFEGLGHLGLITGSNMAGKSTFLRTVGINTVLANAGGPVIAQNFKWQPIRVFSSMKITDSVTEGYSYFFAEVRRLRALYEALLDPNVKQPLLFLIDEIFKGTNTKERLIGSRGYIRALSGANGFGLVATHDLELIRLSEDSTNIHNLHFEETFLDGQMHFSYRLLPGPCTSTNALHIMRQAGLPLDS